MLFFVRFSNLPLLLPHDLLHVSEHHSIVGHLSPPPVVFLPPEADRGVDRVLRLGLGLECHRVNKAVRGWTANLRYLEALFVNLAVHREVELVFDFPLLALR